MRRAMIIRASDSARARHLRLQAARVVTTMSRGASLYLTHTRHGACYALSNGTRIPSEIAQVVISHACVRSADDGLFKMTPQAWKYSDDLPS
jgi:hypothetical protein